MDLPPQTLTLHDVPKDVGGSLSALVRVGADLWLGADEGTSLVRTNTKSGFAGSDWSAIGTFDLIPRLDLPGKNPKPKKKPDDRDVFPEVDVEGIDYDGHHLWVVASHSLKRTQPKEKKDNAENWERLEEVEADGNRYLLGRLPLDGHGDLLDSGTATAEHCAARLPCNLFESDLLEELRKDKLLARYIAAKGVESKECNLPGKDNGMDIEGLAAVGPNHLLIGLRGPVHRGWALALEVKLTCGKPPAEGRPAMLQLEKIGKHKYRRLAFQLGEFRDPDDPYGEAAARGGLGIRDLCFDEGGDLLILAGPTMVLPWPVQVFRWPGAREKLNTDTEDLFVWGKELRLELNYVPPSVNDRAESLCILGSGLAQRLVIGYDNERRLSITDEEAETGNLTLEAFPLIAPTPPPP